MLIQKVTNKTKCEFTGCKNLAEIIIMSETDNKNKMCFCNNCIGNIYNVYAKQTTPKGIEAPFKKQKKLR